MLQKKWARRISSLEKKIFKLNISFHQQHAKFRVLLSAGSLHHYKTFASCCEREEKKGEIKRRRRKKVNQPAMLAVETTTKHRFNPQNPRNMVHPLPSKREEKERERERKNYTQRRQRIASHSTEWCNYHLRFINTSDTNTNEGTVKMEGKEIFFYGN